MEEDKINSIKEFIDKISYAYDNSMEFIVLNIFCKIFFSLFEEKISKRGSKKEILDLVDNKKIKEIVFENIPFFKQEDKLQEELSKVVRLYGCVSHPHLRLLSLCESLFNKNKETFKIVLEKIDANIKAFEIESLFNFLLNNENEIENKLKLLLTFIDNIKKELNISDELSNTIFKIIENIYYSICKSVKEEKYGDNIGYILSTLIPINKQKNKIYKDEKKLIDIIDKIKKFYNSFKEEHKYRVVFRAISKYNKAFSVKDELPSLFNRKYTSLKENEENIYYDFISSNPNEFNGMTTFDTLTKMRHYEVPNRLLDVTTDPLLALFFACGENDDGSKVVCIYSVKEEYVKNYDSDTITVLTMLAKLKKYHRETLKKIVDVFKKANGNYYNSDDNISIKYKKEEKKFDEIKQIKNLEIEELEIKEFTEGNVNVKVFFNYLVSKFVDELNWKLKQENPGWREGLLDLETFTTCYLVKPKMNNPRIIAQSGAFFIYPFDDADITKSLYMNKYEICKIDSLKIKRELDLLNINETKYMPDDLTKYANDIRKKYE